MPDEQRIGVYKLYSILTSTRASGTETFETLDAMPAVIRAECVRALESNQTATVLIADAAGREYLQTMLAHEAVAQRPRAAASRRFPWRLTAEILFVAGAGLAIWILAILR